MAAFISRDPDGGTEYGSLGEQATDNENLSKQGHLLCKDGGISIWHRRGVDICFQTKANFIIIQRRVCDSGI